MAHRIRTYTYNFPDIVTSQFTLPILYIFYDFVRLLAHCPHVQLGLITVTFTDMLVQTAPGTVGKALRNEYVCPLPRA